MKFRAERDALVEALSTTGRAVASRPSIMALTGVRMEVAGGRLRLTGSDLDLTVSAAMEVVEVNPGLCVIPARLATDIVKSLEPGAVTFAVDGEEAVISGGRSQFTVRLLPTEEFLQLPSPADREAVTLEAAALVHALRQVVPAASRDDARPVLGGVLFEADGDGIRLVATDSYRLALRSLPGTHMLEEGQRVLIPGRALGELVRILDSAEKVELRLGEQDAHFTVGEIHLTTRLIEGEFPNYSALIPDRYPNRVVVAKSALVDAAKRVKLLAREATPIRMLLRADGIELSAITHDVGRGKEDVDAAYDGTEMTVAFNPDFLITGIEACPGDEAALEVLDALKPATIRSVDGDAGFLYLLMPVRVS